MQNTRLRQRFIHGGSSDRLAFTDLLEIGDLLLQSGQFRFRVAGWSMYPALRKGDRITVEPVGQANLRVGDLLLFHHQGQLLCHRLVAMEETGAGPRIITKGDAVTGCDPPLPADQVLGRVVALERGRLSFGWMALTVDRWREQLKCLLGGGLAWLQGLPSYRRVMRTLLSRFFTYWLGVPHGRWYQYHPIDDVQTVGRLKQSQQFHLLAKACGGSVGSLHLVQRADGYWVEALYVRRPFRGLGVGSTLLALACDLAVCCKARRIRAVLDREHGAARGLFGRMEFHQSLGDAARPDSVMTRCLDPVPRQAPNQELAGPFKSSPATTGQQPEALPTFQRGQISCGDTATLWPEAQAGEDRPPPRG